MQGSERRQHPCYPRDSLDLKVTRPSIKGMLTLNPEADRLNWSQSGLQFDSDRKSR